MNENMAVAVHTFLALCGGIAIVGGAVAVVRGWLTPAFKVAERINDLESNDMNQCGLLESLIATNKLLCQCMVTLLDHEITGNGIEQIKVVKAELQKHLIEK